MPTYYCTLTFFDPPTACKNTTHPAVVKVQLWAGAGKVMMLWGVRNRKVKREIFGGETQALQLFTIVIYDLDTFLNLVQQQQKACLMGSIWTCEKLLSQSCKKLCKASFFLFVPVFNTFCMAVMCNVQSLPSTNNIRSWYQGLWGDRSWTGHQSITITIHTHVYGQFRLIN